MSTSAARYHHGDLRAALLAAALPVLREQGPAALSLRGLARAAGVSPMAPYRHFADKDSLLAAVAAEGFNAFAGRLRTATEAAADPRAGLLAQGVAYVRFACEERALFRLMFGATIGGAAAQAKLRSSGAPAYAVLERAVAALTADLTRRPAITLASWSLAHGLASLLVDGLVPGADLDSAEGLAAIEAMARTVLAEVLPADTGAN